jgi:hypothetical protein
LGVVANQMGKAQLLFTLSSTPSTPRSSWQSPEINVKTTRTASGPGSVIVPETKFRH